MDGMPPSPLRTALVALGALALAACGGGSRPEFGASDPIRDTLPVRETFCLMGNAEVPGLTIGDDAATGMPAVGILVFESAAFDGGILLDQVVLVARQEVAQGSPFAKMGDVVVDVLDGSSYDAYRASAITGQELAATAPLVSAAGVLSDSPVAGERRMDLSALELDTVALRSSNLVLRLRFLRPAGADGGGDQVSFRALGVPDAPRMEYAYRIVGM